MIEMTKKETAVYNVLLSHEVATRLDILIEAFDVHPDIASKIATRSVDMTVSRLKAKMPDCVHIESVRGVGYRMLVG